MEPPFSNTYILANLANGMFPTEKTKANCRKTTTKKCLILSLLTGIRGQIMNDFIIILVDSYVMSRHVLSRMSRHAMSRHATSCHVTSRSSHVM